MNKFFAKQQTFRNYDNRDIVNTLEKIFIVAIQLQNGKVVVTWSVVFVTNINNLLMNMGFGRWQRNYG
jgi:hypothetical protein